MNSMRSTFAVLLVASMATAAGFFGFNFVQQMQTAQAADKPEIPHDQLAKVDNLASVFRYVGKVVEPTVVNITVTKTTPSVGGRRFHGNMPFDRDQLRRFFPDLPDFDIPDDGNVQQGTGSGVILEAGNGVGYILTNNHVAGDASSMEITLYDGRKVTNGKLVGKDEKTDLAVIKIEADRLTAAKWGNSEELQKGDWIMAFGSPFGYVGSMTHGIVSSLNRHAGILGRYGYENFIQVDAPINPGNSGGPLVNIRGEVVGINTAIASRTGSFSGIGFAIPSNQAKFVYDSLKKNGKVVRGWLGVSISDVSRDLPKAQSFGFKGTQGVLVEQLVPNTPANGKLEVGDIITAIDGKPVESVQQLRNVVAATPPNTTIKMTVFRDGKEQQVELKLGEQPADLAVASGGSRRGESNARADSASAKLGFQYTDATAEEMKKYDLTDVTSGAVIEAVERNSPAAKAGLAPGDVITKIGFPGGSNVAVKSAAELTKALSGADLKKGVRLYITSKDPGSNEVMSRFVFVQAQK